MTRIVRPPVWANSYNRVSNRRALDEMPMTVIALEPAELWHRLSNRVQNLLETVRLRCSVVHPLRSDHYFLLRQLHIKFPSARYLTLQASTERMVETTVDSVQPHEGLPSSLEVSLCLTHYQCNVTHHQSRLLILNGAINTLGQVLCGGF